MVNRDNEVNSLVESLLEENDGVNPAIISLMPVNQQRKNRKRLIEKELKCEELVELIGEAVLAVRHRMPEILGNEGSERVMEELGDAAEKLESGVDMGDEEKPYHQTLGLSDDSLSGLFRLAHEVYNSTDYRLARGLFTLLTYLNPFHIRHWIFLGASLRELGDPDGALSAFRAGMACDADDPLPVLFSIECLHQKREFKEAEPLLQKAWTLLAKHEKRESLQPWLEVLRQESVQKNR